ncbi:hypothetical protein HPB51_006593 [Rhipicephalus microplus]|uniref:Uncharacterized protein n=1 Tax=Rhipicephalus microplus TaxID=6941 RepID=A0A9J6E7L9_RHIMP|nr:hypothetical protein HPB51_006593 [Rhipicephalus microplus]
MHTGRGNVRQFPDRPMENAACSYARRRARPHMQKVPGYAVHQSWHTRVDLSARVHTQSSPEHHAFLFFIGTIYDVFGKIRDDAEEGCARLRERLTGCAFAHRFADEGVFSRKATSEDVADLLCRRSRFSPPFSAMLLPDISPHTREEANEPVPPIIVITIRLAGLVFIAPRTCDGGVFVGIMRAERSRRFERLSEARKLWHELTAKHVPIEECFPGAAPNFWRE